MRKKGRNIHPQKIQRKNNTTGHKGPKKIKAKLNLMKLKAQVEILEYKTAHYKTRYQEIDQELSTEIREL